MTRHVRRPLALSGVGAVLAALVAVLVVANGPAQRIAVAIAVGGMTVLAVGLELRDRGYGLTGTGLALVGVVGLPAGLGWGFATVRGLSPRIELLPALVGLYVLVLGLGSAVAGWERWFTNAGTGSVLVAVFFSGFVHDASTQALLVGTAATVVAWDLSEQAINMGEHVGRQARTWPVELAHVTGAVVVAAAGVGGAIAIGGANITGLPLVGLAGMLVAGVALATALSL